MKRLFSSTCIRCAMIPSTSYLTKELGCLSELEFLVSFFFSNHGTTLAFHLHVREDFNGTDRSPDIVYYRMTPQSGKDSRMTGI